MEGGVLVWPCLVLFPVPLLLCCNDVFITFFAMSERYSRIFDTNSSLLSPASIKSNTMRPASRERVHQSRRTRSSPFVSLVVMSSPFFSSTMSAAYLCVQQQEGEGGESVGWGNGAAVLAVCSALLLLEEEHRLHHAVEIDLHALVMLVDLLLQAVGHLTRLTKVITARGYHNRVRVAIDHLHVIVARDLDGVLERVTASRGDELR